MGDIEDEKTHLKSEDKGQRSYWSATLLTCIEILSHRLKRDGLRLFLLVLANGFYLYIGGVIFYFLERKPTPAVNPRKQIAEIFEEFKRTTPGNYVIDSGISGDKFASNLTSSDFRRVRTLLINLYEEEKSSEATKWTIMNAVFFASTVVTTIGYGNLSPATAWGRVFCVAYAIFGIPLTLILLAKVGKILARYINDMCMVIVNRIRKYFWPEYTYESTDGETDLNAPVWLAMLFISIFLSFDAVVFMFIENWDFGTSLYFIFITLTTIGFGDIVPQNSKAVWFNVTFLYIGLAALSITINLFIANISIQFHKHKDKLHIVKHLEEELESETDNETTPLTRDFETWQSAESQPTEERKSSRVRFQKENEYIGHP